MKISEYNINYGNLDTEHVELLKKQIESGNQIPIRYYKKDNEEWIIDGGHAYTAYTELNKKPEILIEHKFTTPEDMIALSRHCNVNRMKQAPVSYTRSIVEEMKRRFSTSDEEIKGLFEHYRYLKCNKGVKEGIPRTPLNQRLTESELREVKKMDNFFEKEPVGALGFLKRYLPLLSLADT